MDYARAIEINPKDPIDYYANPGNWSAVVKNEGTNTCREDIAKLKLLSKLQGFADICVHFVFAAFCDDTMFSRQVLKEELNVDGDNVFDHTNIWIATLNCDKPRLTPIQRNDQVVQLALPILYDLRNQRRGQRRKIHIRQGEFKIQHSYKDNILPTLAERLLKVRDRIRLDDDIIITNMSFAGARLHIRWRVDYMPHTQPLVVQETLEDWEERQARAVSGDGVESTPPLVPIQLPKYPLLDVKATDRYVSFDNVSLSDV